MRIKFSGIYVDLEEEEETEDVVGAFAKRYKGDLDPEQISVVRQFDCVELRPPKYKVDLRDTIFEGIGYLGSSEYPPPSARHDTVFYAFRVGDYVRVIEGQYARLLLPIRYDGRTVLFRVPHETPLNSTGRPRSPVKFDEDLVKPEAKHFWTEFWKRESAKTAEDDRKQREEYYEKYRPPHEKSSRRPSRGTSGSDRE